MQQSFLLRALVQPGQVGRLLLVLMSLAVLPVSAQTRPQVNVAAVQLKAVGSGFEMDGVVQPVKQSTGHVGRQGGRPGACRAVAGHHR